MAEEDGRLVRVRTPHNLCLIRSGQEWSETADEERRMYVEDVEPSLRAGMDFLRDDGLTIGCFANRYVQQVDTDGRVLEKTYGMRWWRSLQDLDTWAESHSTHVAIFREAMRYLSTMGPSALVRPRAQTLIADRSEHAGVDTDPVRTGGPSARPRQSVR